MYLFLLEIFIASAFLDDTHKFTKKILSADGGLPASIVSGANKAVDALLALNAPLPNFPPLHGVEQELSRKFPRVSRARKIAAIKTAVAAFLQRHAISTDEISGCFLDYAAPCPAGWAEFGNFCLTADGYSGDCQGESEIPNTVQAKRSFARRCVAPWPCLNECARNFRAPCPENWTLSSQGFCLADLRIYRGKCALALDIRNYDDFMRVELSRICDVKFPCLVSPHTPDTLMLPPIKTKIEPVDFKEVPGLNNTAPSS